MMRGRIPWLLIAAALGALVAYVSIQWLFSPAVPTSDFARPIQPTIIEVPEGMTLRQLAAQL